MKLSYGYDYDRCEMTSLCGRAVLGNRDYRLILSSLSNSSNLRNALQKQYQPVWIKCLLMHWAKRHYASQLKDESCYHVDFSCVWRRCC